MNVLQWNKIGEVVKSAGLFQYGLYARYAVMEYIYPSGWRKYKEVLMCTWTESGTIKSQE